MIKSIIIAVVLAALMSVITPAYSMFGGAQLTYVSTDSDVLTVEGNGDTAEMELVKEKGEEAKKVALDADNVLSIEKGDSINVVDDEDFSRALITNSADKQLRIEISDNGDIDLSGYAAGIYTLNVVVDGKKAYECIVVIGPQTQEVIQKEITRVNNKQITEVFIEIIFEIDCGEGFHLNEEDVCVPNEPTDKPTPIPDPGLPYCDLVPEGYKGSCHDRLDYDESTGLYPCRDGSDVEDWRDCPDAGKHPDETEQPIKLTPTPQPEESPGLVPEEYDRAAHCANQAGHEMINGECIDLRDDVGPNPMEEIPTEEPEVPEEPEEEEPEEEEEEQDEEVVEEPEEKSNEDSAEISADI